MPDAIARLGAPAPALSTSSTSRPQPAGRVGIYFEEIVKEVAQKLDATNEFRGLDRDSAISILAFPRDTPATSSVQSDSYEEASSLFMTWAKSAFPKHRLVLSHKIMVD